MMRMFLASLLMLMAPMLSLGSASAEERIRLFKSSITLEDDASLRVEEKITVDVEGRVIKRGITREFPTDYRDKQGHRYRTTFDVESVRRDGKIEPYHTERKQNGVILYIGDANVFLENGTYTYQIIYRTTRQVGYFDDYDELYWNVTGSGWRFPIDQAKFTLSIPRHASPLNIAAYTGRPGASGRDFRIIGDTAGLAEVETTKTLMPGEGFTVAVSFPKGLIHEPDIAENSARFFRDNLGVFFALVGLLGMAGYYIYFWDLRGRDPVGGAIIPRFEPPEGFSPAAARYVRRMAYDRKAFSAAVINMAVKGYLTIEDEKKSFTLKRTGATEEDLTNGERRIAIRLFPGSSNAIEMDNENHIEISGAIRSFEDGLQAEFQHEYFLKNQVFFYGGVGITIAIMVIAALLNSAVALPIPTFIAEAVIATIAGATSLFAMNWTQRRDSASIGLSRGTWVTFLRASRWIVIGVIVLPQFVIGTVLSRELGLALPLIALFFGILNGVFFVLLKAPTKLGRAIQDEIEGFRLYLSTAEGARLDALHPPEKTPELFEKYLPFALALGVDNKWSEQFTSILAAAGEGTTEGSYQPSWYTGRRFRSNRMDTFSSSLGAALSTSIAASAQAPGSSSGSGGGGFSGGGGGGGGGGGW